MIHRQLNYYLNAIGESSMGIKLLFALLMLTFYSSISISQSNHAAIYSISYDDSGLNGDITVHDALLRLPGITPGYRGQLNLRGSGFNRYSVTLDGQRLSTSGFGNRNIDLNSYSLDIFRDIEWLRLAAADSEADALGGTINLRTNRHQVEKRNLMVRVEGGANSEFYRFMGPMARIGVQYSERLRDDLSLGVNIGYLRDFNGWEGFQNEYSSRDFGDGLVDLVEHLSPFMETSGSDRIGGSLNLRFGPSDDQFYYLRAFINYETRENIHHRSIWVSNNNWLDQNTTGPQGRLRYNLSTSDRKTQTYAAQFGGRNSIGELLLEYNLGWTHTTVENFDYSFLFEALNVRHVVDIENRDRPQVETVNNFPTRQNMRLLPMNFMLDRHLDTRYSGRVDLTVPISLLSFKTGASANLSHKNANEEGAFRHVVYTSRTLQTLNDFDEMRVRSFSVLDDAYEIPWLVDAGSAKNFLNSSVPAFATNEQVNRSLTDIWNYGAYEDVYAAYAMTTADFGGLQFYGGVRVEHTIADYEGRVVRFDRFNRYVSTLDTNETTNYTQVFPSVSIGYSLFNNTRVGLSYGRSIQRHDYNILAPLQFISGQDTTVFRGNPKMKPITSDIIEFSVYHAISNSGIISATIYYKELADFIRLDETRVVYSEGEEPVFDYIFEENPSFTEIEATVSQFKNSDEKANIYGFEVGFEQRFTFLPGFFQHFGLVANYSYAIFESSNQREDIVALPNFSPHSLQVSANYFGPLVFANVSYQWTAESIINLQEVTRMAPSINPNDPVYFDQYSDGWSDLSITAGVRFSPKVMFRIDAYNLLGSEQVTYFANRDLYPSGAVRRADRGIMAGIKFQL